MSAEVWQETIDGEEYVHLPEDYYQYLLSEREASRKVRYQGVEELRLWCQANKGTSTLEEGLRACTPRELYEQACAIYNAAGLWTNGLNFVYWMMEKLERRQARAKQEQSAVSVTPITLEEDTP